MDRHATSSNLSFISDSHNMLQHKGAVLIDVSRHKIENRTSLTSELTCCFAASPVAAAFSAGQWLQNCSVMASLLPAITAQEGREATGCTNAWFS